MEAGTNQLRGGPRKLAVLVACAVLALAACGSDDLPAEPERQGISVSEASLSRSGLVLTIDVPSCNANPSATVTQDADEVRIAAEVDIQLGGDTDACLDELRVDLSEPLAERRVVDVPSGREVTVDRS